MVTNEATTVSNKEDVCTLPVTMNTKNQEDIPAGLLISFICLFDSVTYLILHTFCENVV